MLVLLSSFLILLAYVPVGAAQPAESRSQFQHGRCTEVSPLLTSVDQKIASASLYAHFVGGDGLFDVTEEVVQKASKKVYDHPTKGQLCPGNASPFIEFIAVPHQVENDEDSRKECEGFLESSRRSPMRWEGLTAEQDESFSDLFLSFSRGSSDAGEELYERCPGSCSPNYRVFIPIKDGAPEGVVDVEVVCGLPRDTSDDQYEVSVRVSCPCTSF